MVGGLDFVALSSIHSLALHHLHVKSGDPKSRDPMDGF